MVMSCSGLVAAVASAVISSAKVWYFAGIGH